MQIINVDSLFFFLLLFYIKTIAKKEKKRQSFLYFALSNFNSNHSSKPNQIKRDMAYVEENLVKNQSTSFHDKEVLSFNNKLKSNVIEVGSINDVQEPGSSASSDLTARTGNA